MTDNKPEPKSTEKSPEVKPMTPMTPPPPTYPSETEKMLVLALKDVLFAHDELGRMLQRMGMTVKPDDAVERARRLAR